MSSDRTLSSTSMSAPLLEFTVAELQDASATTDDNNKAMATPRPTTRGDRPRMPTHTMFSPSPPYSGLIILCGNLSRRTLLPAEHDRNVLRVKGATWARVIFL